MVRSPASTPARNAVRCSRWLPLLAGSRRRASPSRNRFSPYRRGIRCLSTRSQRACRSGSRRYSGARPGRVSFRSSNRRGRRRRWSRIFTLTLTMCRGADGAGDVGEISRAPKMTDSTPIAARISGSVIGGRSDQALDRPLRPDCSRRSRTRRRLLRTWDALKYRSRTGAGTPGASTALGFSDFTTCRSIFRR